MDVFEQLLTSGSRGSVSPETLEYIGQKASNAYLEKRASLNSAIVKLASQHPELNNEHIHRIAEFANNSTFQQLFEKNQDKNVHFDIADPGTIIRDLRDGGSPAHSGKVLHNKSDYFRAPLGEEKDGSMGMDGSGAGDPESGLADLFNRENSSGQFGQGEPIQKVASAAGLDPSWEGSANPVNDIYAQHLKLQRSKEEIGAAYESADLMLKQACVDFYKAAKAEVLSPDGAGFRGVMEAFSQVAGTVTQEDTTKIAERLMREGVSAVQLAAGMTKTAGRLLNPEHPLVKAAAGMVKCAHEVAVAYEALTDLEAALEKTAGFLRSGLARAGLMAGGLTAAAAGSGQLPQLADQMRDLPGQLSSAAHESFHPTPRPSAASSLASHVAPAASAKAGFGALHITPHVPAGGLGRLGGVAKKVIR